MSHFTIWLKNSYLNSNVSESPIIIAKMRLEVGELLASGGHTQAVVLVEFENSPAKEIGTLQLNGTKKPRLAQPTNKAHHHGTNHAREALEKKVSKSLLDLFNAQCSIFQWHF